MTVAEYIRNTLAKGIEFEVRMNPEVPAGKFGMKPGSYVIEYSSEEAYQKIIKAIKVQKEIINSPLYEALK